MKKCTVFAFAIIGVLSNTFSVLAAPTQNPALQTGKVVSNVTDSVGTEKLTVVTGDIVEEIEITADGVIYVNGRNITTVTKSYRIPYAKGNSDWTYAGSYTYKYDLSGLTVAGGVNILKSLGKTLAASAFKAAAGSYIVGAIFQTGSGIEDIRDTYYRNIHQQRPDMKEVHTVNFFFEIYGGRQYEKYLCGFTTGG